MVGGEAGVVGLAVVNAVVPSRAAEAGAVARAGQVQLGQQVQPVGDQALFEVVVAVVLVDGQRRLRRQRGRGALEALHQAVLDGVVPAQGPVGVAGVDLDRRGRLCGQQRQKEAGKRGACGGPARRGFSGIRSNGHGLSPCRCGVLVDPSNLIQIKRAATLGRRTCPGKWVVRILSIDF
ncbi:hypothetical protein D9M68_836630 [compost metagenome]